MRLSTRVRYGTRAMLDLAIHYGQGQIFLKDIAERQAISLKYLDRIFASLKAAGLVKALRGSKGGYALTRQPSGITLRQVVEALEGPIQLVGCVSDKDYCKRENSCVMHDIWFELGRAMEGVLKTTTLEDLIIRGKKKHRAADKMYYI